MGGVSPRLVQTELKPCDLIKQCIFKSSLKAGGNLLVQ